MHTQLAIGIDIGGTNIRIALVDASGALVGINKQPTDAGREMHQILGDIAQGIGRLMSTHKVPRQELCGIGLGAPGFLSIQAGVIHSSPNLPTVREVPVVSILHRLTDLPVYLENDANAAAIGEHWMGAGQGSRNLLCVTLGTGLGSGFIFNDTVWHGSNDLAGELGHTTLFPEGLPCKCGRRGCLEAYVSATGIVTRTEMALRAGRHSSLAGYLNRPHDPLSAYAVYEHAQQGDRLSREILEETGSCLAIALANVLNLLDLETIIIGGQVAQAGDLLLRPTIHAVTQRALRAPYYPIRILPAQLGDHAGVVGAAKTVFDRSER